MPPSISLEQMTGFSLFVLKAVLRGRGDEIIDLAKINLFHCAALPTGRRAEDIGFEQAPRRHKVPPDAGDELGRLV